MDYLCNENNLGKIKERLSVLKKEHFKVINEIFDYL